MKTPVGGALGVFVLERDPMIRAGLVSGFSCRHDFVVLGAESAPCEVQESSGLPDVVIAAAEDAPDDLARLLPQRWRELSIEVVIRTTSRAPTHLLELLERGAKHLVAGKARPGQLREAVRTAASGGVYRSPDLALVVEALTSHRATGPFGLTGKEMLMLELLPTGLTNREIGQRTRLGEQTVKTHVHKAMRKLGARGRAHAAAIAVGEGLAMPAQARPPGAFLVSDHWADRSA